MEEKIKIELPKTKTKTVEFCGQKVKVKTHISPDDSAEILNDLKKKILDNTEVEDKMVTLDIRFIQDVLYLCTNIDTADFTSEDYSSIKIDNFLYDYIDNYYTVFEYVQRLYEQWVIENSFGILGGKMPSAEEMEESMDAISKAVNDMPTDKLELIAKSITWNNMPTLGAQIAPAEHIGKSNVIEFKDTPKENVGDKNESDR